LWCCHSFKSAVGAQCNNTAVARVTIINVTVTKNSKGKGCIIIFNVITRFHFNQVVCVLKGAFNNINYLFVRHFCADMFNTVFSRAVSGFFTGNIRMFRSTQPISHSSNDEVISFDYAV